MAISTLLLIVWLHFIADFILQSDKMAINKSKSFGWLTAHAAVYGLPLMLFGWKFSLLNAALHWTVDAITSRITTYLWVKQQRHWFFVVIGVDQAVHMTCLFLTYGVTR